jgi:transcriptional regulator with XRE-family HTH domain
VCYIILIQIERGIIMNEIQVVKTLMKTKGISGAILAEKLGYKTPSAVTKRLQSRTMTVEKLVELLGAMDCELIIKNKVGDKETFVVDNEDRQSVKIYKKGDAE